ncbi:hypothetical protein [Streptomyces sp. G1]|uniref:hypothetical protein n=1 Tax=Streptomyces sp. G1 TaxID=361572 RepID=UPI00202F7AEA|nr:hypothetical protein [Streptomyces sp. G1]MCM1964862.1 hypothetical protein [Streptomyces sp. G1]
MTPEQTRASMNLTMIGRLVQRHGLTAEEAATAVAQHSRGETGPHTPLIAAEAFVMLGEFTARLRAALIEAFAPAMERLAAGLAQLARNVQTLTEQDTGRRRSDRPAWVSPYGPPARRR